MRVILLLVTVACSLVARDGALASATPIAVLADPAVTESSGLAASRRQPGLLWTQNDSGGGPILFATDETGAALGRFAVPGVENIDWEDLAIGPGVDGDNALFIADIGNNAGSRQELVIWHVLEPEVDLTSAPDLDQRMVTQGALSYPFRYPDGFFNAETLLVHPTTGETLVVTKSFLAAARVYAFPTPNTPDELATLVLVGEIDFPGLPGPGRAATGGAVSAEGDRVVIRTYQAAYEWPVATDQALAEALLEEPAPITLPAMPAGEAVSYDAHGQRLLLTSEGSPCPLYERDLAIDPSGQQSFSPVMVGEPEAAR